MPGAKTHDTINITVLAALIVFLYYMTWTDAYIAAKYLNNYILLVFSVSYLFATFFLSPDLDINSRPYKRWGILRVLWWPYKVIFKHRGYSHHPVIGPLSIVLNLAAIITALLLLGGVDLQRIPITLVIAAIAGMVLSMEIHIVSDSVISRLKNVL